ncbi:hypothetical protein D7D52_08005 [Nocardia yunnanensis]|uniref:Uncharacterized protein n=1 Tax=Nocardia yunnanensis TaxID=2382165 RepID=A0A386Z885_9NOCA|nr:hypothetical protein [Nocardia yunnanensis]AYF73816.1 hypothetical protein D7D52_08005 [Nocardia yunnanensis]
MDRIDSGDATTRLLLNHILARWSTVEDFITYMRGLLDDPTLELPAVVPLPPRGRHHRETAS